MPTLGTVGCSGDLGPLAHIVGAMIGYKKAEAIYSGQRMPARKALEKAGLSETFTLKAKDALALVKMADITGALSLEATRGELMPLTPAIKWWAITRGRPWLRPLRCN